MMTWGKEYCGGGGMTHIAVRWGDHIHVDVDAHARGGRRRGGEHVSTTNTNEHLRLRQTRASALAECNISLSYCSECGHHVP
jgi:hypothetical protein